MPEELTNHLWQSTVFAVVAGLLTLALRKNRARVRHWLWFTASVKFLIPLSLLIALGSRIEWKTPPMQTTVVVAVDQIVQPFTEQVISTPTPESSLPNILFALWMTGVIGISCAWWVRWQRVRAAVRIGSPVGLGLPIRVVCSPTTLEPGVFGIFRPVLLLPEGIFDRLPPAQLKSILAHELCHVRHHDNLLAAIHMFVETIFWFHPLVWFIGKRMVAEREQACDEEVLRELGEPQAYAEGILSVCKLYVESPLTCVAGVTGADLKRRIEAIMKNRRLVEMSVAKKILLASAGILALALPIAIGMTHVPALRAQAPLQFEVASIRLSGPRSVRGTDGGPGSRSPESWVFGQATLQDLLAHAWDVKYFQISSRIPLDREQFDVAVKMSANTSKEQFRAMLQNLLAERFRLQLHIESREFQAYELVVAKSGHKLLESPVGTPFRNARLREEYPQLPDDRPAMSARNSFSNGFAVAHLAAQRQPLSNLAMMLQIPDRRPIVERTGLTGTYDFTLEYLADTGRSLEGAPPLADVTTAVREQLGLELVSKKLPFDLLVVESVERTPSEN